ncbi:MAG: (Fe-S)-binding protein [bacterium]
MKVALFITCIADQLYPQVGRAVVRVLRKLGDEVEFPEAQTCCGQPAFNFGFREEAKAVAMHFLKTFEHSDCIVCPAGSCATMVRRFYGELFEEKGKGAAADAEWRTRWQAVAAKIFEFSEYLDKFHKERLKAILARKPKRTKSGETKMTYHDSCHLLRELHISDQPRDILKQAAGVEYLEMERATECCGFGGLFSVYNTEVSAQMADAKIATVQRCGANAVVACDSGCLMHLQGRVARRRLPIQTLHLAEVLERYL